MTILAEDLRELKRAINGAAEKINCAATLSVRPICIDDGAAGCYNVYGVYKITESGTQLIRLETVDGALIDEQTATIVPCVCECSDITDAILNP